jgi:hypothetical protein
VSFTSNTMILREVQKDDFSWAWTIKAILHFNQCNQQQHWYASLNIIQEYQQKITKRVFSSAKFGKWSTYNITLESHLSFAIHLMTESWNSNDFIFSVSRWRNLSYERDSRFNTFNDELISLRSNIESHHLYLPWYDY